MKLIIISGSTATGKTTIAGELSKKLTYGLYSKDKIKEALFEEDRDSGRGFYWYEKAARNIFYQKIGESIALNQPIVIENNFLPNERRRLRSLIGGDTEVVEVYCFARGFSRLKRFVARGESNERHDVHSDRRFYISVFTGCVSGLFGIRWPYGPVTKSRLLMLDTTDFSTVDIQKILEYAK